MRVAGAVQQAETVAAPQSVLWLCDHCDQPAVVFAPGTAPVREPFLLSRGVPMRCWCLEHWRWVHR